MIDLKDVQFFMGSNTKRGFIPLFDQFRNPGEGRRLYILKGGPGSGKSTLMKRLAGTLKEHGHFIEYIPCASDPESLDAIYDHDAKTAIIDGTAPHTMDPEYPGAYDILLNLGDAWDSGILSENREMIIELCSLISRCHMMAGACIASAAALMDCNRAIAKTYVRQNAVKETVLRIAKELKDNIPGREHKRLLSAVTVGKTLFFRQTLAALTPSLYVIPDEWGAASHMLLAGLRDHSLNNNLDFITCYCSIHIPDKIDHLLFPSVKLGITTSNSFHETKNENALFTEDLMKPVDQSDLVAMTDHLSHAKQLIAAAGRHVARAKSLHDDLEKFYINAMDFSKADLMYNRLLEDILG